MPDIIQLLPDVVANQIAAGEVIQRPASVVKELLENSVDAGADEIKLIVKEAGKSLIQVTDNGTGMSDTDARMCFERHATSKIKATKDLFSIKTLGFRGEALASIAAIAQVELKTRKKNQQTGTMIVMEGSQIKDQLTCNCQEGTSFTVKNIFYNVPARRNFLKSNTAEMNHIIDEFLRVALVHPEISFQMYHNNTEIYKLVSGTLIHRLISVFSNSYREKIVPVEQQTGIIKISGFVGKPEYAKKTRGEQFLFVNSRFFKHPYLHHAIENAYEELLPSKSYPSYFIYFDVAPQSIDINIHPSKTEIKFQEEKIIYPLLMSAVKHSIGKYCLTPTIDFNTEQSISNIQAAKIPSDIVPPKISINPDYNPFNTNTKHTAYNSNLITKTNKDKWEVIYPDISDKNIQHKNQKVTDIENNIFKLQAENQSLFQYKNTFIFAQLASGLLVINQQRASERVQYEKYMNLFAQQKPYSQQLLFPQTIQLRSDEAFILKDIMSMLNKLGFDIADFGNNSCVINGLPADTPNNNAQQIIESVIQNYKEELPVDISDNIKRVAYAMAKNSSVKQGKELQAEEMLILTESLFNCKVPQTSPNGKKTYTIIETEEFERKLK